MIEHVYFALEKPDGFNRAEWLVAIGAVVTDLQRQRTSRYVLPHEVLHLGVSLDGNAFILDGLVETENLQPAKVAVTMARAVGLDQAGEDALKVEMQTKRRRLDDVAAARIYWRGRNGSV